MVKYGVPSPEAAWAMTGGIASRQAAIRIATAYLAEAGESSPLGFRRWLDRMDPDEIAEEIGLGGSALESTARAILRSQKNEYLSRLDEGAPLLPMDADVRIPQPSRDEGTAYRLEVGSSVQLVRDYDTTLNRNAVNVFSGSSRLGYLSWQAAQALGPELDAGQEVDATVVWIDEGFTRAGVTVFERHYAESP